MLDVDVGGMLGPSGQDRECFIPRAGLPNVSFCTSSNLRLLAVLVLFIVDKIRT
jgi:hypothetical protein